MLGYNSDANNFSTTTYTYQELVGESFKDALLEAVTLVIGKNILKGTLENSNKVIREISEYNLYEMFNINVINRVEEIFIGENIGREFILNSYTHFLTILKMNTNFDMKTVIDILSKTVIEAVNLFAQHNNKEYTKSARLKALIDSIIPRKELTPQEYLTQNPWYSIVVLINLYFIEIDTTISAITGKE